MSADRTWYPHGFAHVLRQQLESYKAHVVVDRVTLESLADLLETLPRNYQAPTERSEVPQSVDGGAVSVGAAPDVTDAEVERAVGEFFADRWYDYDPDRQPTGGHDDKGGMRAVLEQFANGRKPSAGYAHDVTNRINGLLDCWEHAFQSAGVGADVGTIAIDTLQRMVQLRAASRPSETPEARSDESYSPCPTCGAGEGSCTHREFQWTCQRCGRTYPSAIKGCPCAFDGSEL